MSDREYPLYTIKNNCVDCYKCVRRCPVKAIKIEDGSAQIVPDLCIACGTCYRVCPAKAKQPRNDLTRAKHLSNRAKTFTFPWRLPGLPNLTDCRRKR